MKRSIVYVAVAVLCAGVLPAAPAAAPGIKAGSHEHPEGEDFSYVCWKTTGKAGRTYKATVTGPSYPDGATRKFKMPKSGRKRLTFEIDSAGEYTLVLRRRSTVLDTHQYTVPPPDPGPAMGPFPCT